MDQHGLALLFAPDLARQIEREHRYETTPAVARAGRRSPWLRGLFTPR